MANKHIKYAPPVIRNMQIKKMRNYPIPIRMAKIQTVTTPNVAEDVHQQELSFTVDGNTKWYSQFGRVW